MRINHIIRIMTLVVFSNVLGAEESAKHTNPYYIVECQNGVRSSTIKKNGKAITVVSEIGGSLTLSVRGDFKKVHIQKALVIAPDGRTYSLRIFGEQPPAIEGTYTKFLSIEFDERQHDFSIGLWKVRIMIKIDDTITSYEPDYKISWRKPAGKWGLQLWANDDSEVKVKVDKSRFPHHNEK